MERIGGGLPARSIAVFWSALVVLGAACAPETADPVALATPSVASPAQGWARQFGSAGPDEATSVAVDATGNVYVAGWADGGVDGEIGAGSYDSFVRKYDPSGTVLWTRQFGSAQEDGASDVEVDADGNVYVVGRTGEEPVVESTDVRWDAYVRKLGPDGSELFYRNGGEVMVVAVTTGQTFSAETPTPLFAAPYPLDTAGAGGNPNYDISPDGEQFIFVEHDSPSGLQGVAQINVVLNWHLELLERVPVP